MHSTYAHFLGWSMDVVPKSKGESFWVLIHEVIFYSKTEKPRVCACPIFVFWIKRLK